jgi:RNA polymerase-binding transcription factor DksA
MKSLAALRRIDAGNYGVCEICGVDIAQERLDALPDARTCVQCSDRSGSGLRSNVNHGRVAD